MAAPPDYAARAVRRLKARYEEAKEMASYQVATCWRDNYKRLIEAMGMELTGSHCNLHAVEAVEDLKRRANVAEQHACDCDRTLQAYEAARATEASDAKAVPAPAPLESINPNMRDDAIRALIAHVVAIEKDLAGRRAGVDSMVGEVADLREKVGVMEKRLNDHGEDDRRHIT